MHIALYTPAWPLEDSPNGIVTYVKHMREGLMALGHQVSIVSGFIGPSNRDSDIHLVKPGPLTSLVGKVAYRLKINLVTHFGRAIADTLRRVHADKPIDLIEMEESFAWFKHVQALGIPTVVKLHGPAFLSLVEEELNMPGSQKKIACEGLALRRAVFITSPSVRTLQETVARYQLKVRSAHARNPLDPQPYAVWSADAADADTVLFVGRFDKRKGGDTVLQAFKRVLQRNPRARLVFVGPDRGLTQPDGSLLRFDAFAQTLFTPAERAQIDYRGHLSPREVEQLRLQARVTLIASRWENAAYTAAEALAQGCPVVAIDGNVSEVVIDNVTGLLARSSDTLADGILALMQDRERAATLGAAARQFIIETHAPAVAVGVAMSIYHQVLQRSPA